MSAYRSMIDEALAAAQARVGTPAAEIQKAASAEDSLIKEASDLANALEFVSLSASGDGAVGSFRSEMVRDYYKQAAAGGPAESSTTTSGTQAQPPAAGKKKINPTGLVGGNAPKQTSASPAGKDGQKAMLESFKEAEGQSLYDILMANKEAAAGGPAEYCSESKGPLKNRLLGALGSNSAPVNAKKRQLKAPTRERLREAFAYVGDVTSDASAQAIFPRAKSKGSLKVAMGVPSGLVGAFRGAGKRGIFGGASKLQKTKKPTRSIGERITKQMIMGNPVPQGKVR